VTLPLDRALFAAAGLALLACGSAPAGKPDACGAACTGADGGADAGLPDGAAFDGGASDSGSVDSGPVDAGSADAGGPDAASVDAGSGDAGASDAGPGDAGVTDAGRADAGASDGGGALLSGKLVGGEGPYPGPIEGVRFRTATQSGYTDATGAFAYRSGETLTFGVADVDFRPTPGAPEVSPWQLAAQGQCSQSAELVRLLVLLYSLDQDGDPATGTQLPAAAPGGAQRAFSSLSDGDVATLIAQLIPGRTPIAGSAATHLFIAQMDGEVWAQIAVDTFTGLVAGQRSQGAATDGSAYYFSWRLGFDRTDLAYNSQKTNALAIPLALSLLGCNHIGDVDYWGGVLYAPIEDGSAYQHPHLAFYDPSTLTAGNTYALPTTLLTKGVPWVAADGPRASLYVAEWDPTPSIFAFDMATVTNTSTLPLSTTVGRIQGGKVFEGSLYLSSDNTAKSIYKVNLETGTVMELWSFNQTFEEEGLVFLSRPDGSLLHTLNTANNNTAMELRHHQRTRGPLRKDVCP
jgi:hypothetical protein